MAMTIKDKPTHQYASVSTKQDGDESKGAKDSMVLFSYKDDALQACL